MRLQAAPLLRDRHSSGREPGRNERRGAGDGGGGPCRADAARVGRRALRAVRRPCARRGARRGRPPSGGGTLLGRRRRAPPRSHLPGGGGVTSGDAPSPGHALDRLSSWAWPAALAAFVAAAAVALRGIAFEDADRKSTR